MGATEVVASDKKKRTLTEADATLIRPTLKEAGVLRVDPVEREREPREEREEKQARK